MNIKGKYYKKQSPEQTKKTIAYNKKTYSKELKELRILVETKKADNFTVDMYIAIIGGRKITDKMLNAINNIIKRNKPAELEKKRMEADRLLGKTRLVKEVLLKCKYHDVYETRSMDFINSVESQIRKYHNLTKKQKIALNKMYQRFMKKSENKA